MATPAFTVTCAFAGSSTAREKSQSILSEIVWQEAPSASTLSTNAAPTPTDTYGQSVFRAHATSDSWFSYGRSPNSAGSKRVLVPAGTECDFFAEAGDKFMWALA